ncbi:nucleotidyl transferase AbiEii/AbiGii toxin family protein [candidate division KSB1 bacterium]|nr:nucleotidyl transferase AbiEii/AbiGii toxin family protein [candidate division KSB1 bacterium]
MITAGALTFQEFMSRERLPLATIHEAVLEFLRGRDNVAVFGAQAVNAYVEEPRMMQTVDLLSTRAAELVKELRDHLREQFHIALRVRELEVGKGFRLYQVQKPENRHLVDVRPVETLPATRRIAKVLIVAPVELLAHKVIAYHQRKGKPKSGTDWRDLAMLLLTFSELKQETGALAERLKALGADKNVLQVWKHLVSQEIKPADEEDF